MSKQASHPTVVLDLEAERAVVGDRTVDLRPKTWAVLRYLVERAGQLVTKDELLDAVWAETAVSEGILSKSVSELRLALEDSGADARSIETVPRRGFRWIGQAEVRGGGAAPRAAAQSPGAGTAVAAADAPPAALPDPEDEPDAGVVARAAELAFLQAALARARRGRREVVFVSGDPGAGKSAVVDAFLAAVGHDVAVRIAHGQCLETSGQHEPYLPLFEALERLARSEKGRDVEAQLERVAPSWLAQMPSLASSRAAAANAAPGRMLREFVSLLEEASAKSPLVLVLEDAHWADLATMDACRAIVGMRGASRLLLVVTMRKAEAVVLDHPVASLCREASARGEAVEMAVEPFDEADVRAYVASRCPGLEDDAATVRWLLHQTGGNPLFVRLVMDEWAARLLVEPGTDGRWRVVGDVAEMRRTVPDSLLALVEGQLAELPESERDLLDAASVRLGDFTATSLAAASGLEAEDAERVLRRVVRRGSLLKAREARRGASDEAERYLFLHALVQNVVAESLPGTRRRRLHRAAAVELEREFAGRTPVVAAQLAVHWEAAGEAGPAVRYLREASVVAMRRDSPRDAVGTLEHAVALVEATPALPDHDDELVTTTRALSHARQLVHGFQDPEVMKLWQRTRELADDAGDPAERLMADAGSAMAYCVAGRYAEAEELVRATMPRVEAVDDPGARQSFLFTAANVRYRIAAFDDSCALFDAAMSLDVRTEPVAGADFVAVMQSQYSPVLALVGRPDDARRLIASSLERARAHNQYTGCVTTALASWALAFLLDHEAAAPIAEEALALAEAAGFGIWKSRPQLLLGVHAIANGRHGDGLARANAAMESRRSEGQGVDMTANCCLLAEAILDAGLDGADGLLDEAAQHARDTGELFFESEVLRLRARMAAASGASAGDVELALRRSLELADMRGGRWHALRSAHDLAGLLSRNGRPAEARAALEPALGAIRGGTDLAAVRDARALLAELAG